MPKVSIIMPVYNVEKYIDASIQSVLNQTYKDYELILVDDGSTDKSSQICDDYATKYSNVNVIHTPNSNRAKTRDRGIEQASGKYILFVDSDDTISSDLLKDVVSAAESTDADVTIFGMHVVTTNDGEFVGEDFRNHEPQFFSTRAEVEKNFVKMNKSLMWNHPVDKLIKRSVIVDNNIKGESSFDGVCEDTVFLLDMFPYVNSICVIDGCYYEYAIRNSQSVVSKYIPDRYSKLYGRYIKTKGIIESLDYDDKNMELLYEMYCNFLIWSYEFMFHKDCKLSLFARYTYIRETFSITKESNEFCKNAEAFYETSDLYKNMSGTTKMVFRYLIKKNYFLAWLFHVIALVRN